LRVVDARIRPARLAALAATLTLTLVAGRAEAQFGFRNGGLGFGYGYGFGYYRPASVDYLNQRSLQNASRATMGPVRYDFYANNPNAYINHLHDPGYLAGYDVGTRREIEARIGRFSDGPPPSRLARRARREEPAEVRPSPQSPPGPATAGPSRASRPAAVDPEPPPPPTPSPVRPPAAG
jgi:hypothetical protein